MNYTKHQIKRIRDLNDNYFEVVFAKQGLKFAAGSTVTLYKGPEFPIFIASGIQEPWLRLILNRDLFSPYFKPGTSSIKLNLEIENKLPSLMAEEKPAFVFDTQTIGAFFSWSSSNAGKKCKVCYVGEDKIQEDWIGSSHSVVKAPDSLKMKKCDSLYITGHRDLFEGKRRKLLNVAKGSLLIG